MSDTVKKRIGLGTSYGFAKSTGRLPEGMTADEYADFLADFVTAAQTAVDARDAARAAQSAAETAQGSAETAATQAAGSATTASGAASNATQKAGEASTYASNAGASASQAQTYASNAEQSATAASGSASAASGSASAAAGSASAAHTSETNAAESETAAAESAAQAKEAARTLTIDPTLTQTGQAAEAKKVGDEFADLKSQLETKAEIDGYYQDMTVGDAEQMISTQYVEDTEPYLYRTTGGTSDVGNREYVRKIVGGTLAWNQLVQNGNFVDTTVWNVQHGSLAVNGGVATLTPSNDGSSCLITQNMNVKSHVYFAAFSVNTPSSTGVINFEMRDASSVRILCASSKTEQWEHCESVYKISSDHASGYVRIKTSTAQTAGQAFAIKDVTLYDLTQMFGSAIADYIYQLEQTTEGAGVAFFRKLFPLDYYPYDAGTLKSVEGLQGHEMVGINLYDPDSRNRYNGYPDFATSGAFVANSSHKTVYIPCLPNTQYTVSRSRGSTNERFGVCWTKEIPQDGVPFDGFARAAQSGTIGDIMTLHTTTGPDAKYLAVWAYWAQSGSDPLSDFQINLTWSGTHDGEYEPYVKHSYALDDSLTLRGIPKLSDDGKLMYDGDRYLPDGTVERRYGVVDLGTLTWSTTAANRASTTIPNLKNPPSVYRLANIITANNYTQKPASESLTTDGEFAIIDRERNITFYYSENLPSGLLVYELATPTTETATPYPEVQLCDDWGTERFVTDSIVPVGTETDYPANLRDKLQHLPDLASADGYYAIKQVGTQMTLEPFRIPKAPTTDGTYTLRATVSGGVPTYTWEQEVVVNASEEA